MSCSWVGRSSAVALMATIGFLALGASGASAHKLDPPPWWTDGRALIEKRGGTCEQSTRQSDGGGFSPVDPATGQITPRGSFTEESIRCSHRIPLATAKAVGGTNPNATTVSEGCSASAEDSSDPAKRKFDNYIYLCSIYADPGTETKPNRASWRCQREKSRISLGQGETTDEPAWTARKTKVFPARVAPTLAGCLAPRAALDEPATPTSQARRQGVKLPVTCSRACTVVVSGGARRVRRKLAAGRRTVLRIPLGQTTARLGLMVSAAGYRSVATIRTRARGGAVHLNAPDTLSLKK